MSRDEPTTTAYAILGLLAIRPWTTYELARQMERSLHNFWPRAESNLYAAAKTLVNQRLATARTEHVGRRARILYSITPKGRAALRRWIPQPGSGPVLEFESLLKIFYAENGTQEHLLAHLADIKARAEETLDEGRRIAGEYVNGTGLFPERTAVNSLIFEFVVRHAEMISAWADWAQQRVRGWPQSPTQWPRADDVFRSRVGGSHHPGGDVATHSAGP